MLSSGGEHINYDELYLLIDKLKLLNKNTLFTSEESEDKSC